MVVTPLKSVYSATTLMFHLSSFFFFFFLNIGLTPIVTTIFDFILIKKAMCHKYQGVFNSEMRESSSYHGLSNINDRLVKITFQKEVSQQTGVQHI